LKKEDHLYDSDMIRAVIVSVTAAGQLSRRAPVRRRWGTSRVLITDEGHQVVEQIDVFPLPNSRGRRPRRA
jgi:hypothetical protein